MHEGFSCNTGEKTFLGDKMHFCDAPRFKSAFLISLALLLISNIKTGHSEDKIHEEQI